MEEEKTKNYDDIAEIVCPHCGEEQFYEIVDRGGDFVSYWGEESVDEECHECKKSFFIQERVSRYWEVAKDYKDF